MLKIDNVTVKPRTEGRSHGYGSRTRIYFFVKNESLLSNLVARRSRPVDEYKKLLPEVFMKALGLTHEQALKYAKVTSWSQRAGCGCGCSPGFLVNKGFSYGREIFVDVVGEGLEGVVKNDSEAVALVNARMASIKADPTLTMLFTKAKDEPRYFGEDA